MRFRPSATCTRSIPTGKDWSAGASKSIGRVRQPSRRRNRNRKRGADSRHSAVGTQSKYDIAIPKRNVQVAGQVFGGRVGMNKDLRGLPLASATLKRPKTHLCGIFGLSKGNINGRKGKLGDGKPDCRRHDERKFGSFQELLSPHSPAFGMGHPDSRY